MCRQRWYARREPYSHRMARAAILVVAACSLFATACTAGHPAPAQTGVGTPAPATSLSAHANVSAGPPPVRAPRIPVAVAARRQCSEDPLRSGRPRRILHQSDMRSLSEDRLRGSCWLPADGSESPALLGQDPLGCRFLPRRPAIAAHRSSTRCRYACRVIHLASGFGAGEIYPSEIVAPSPGCWQFTLSWSGHTDTVDLWYVKHR